MRRIQVQINIRETPTRALRQFTGPFIAFDGASSIEEATKLAKDSMLKQLQEASDIAVTRQPNQPHRGD